MPPLELSSAETRALLAEGDLDVMGRIPWSSNATLLVTVRGDGRELPAVYKPRRGERPLWDFPDGTLCHREVAMFELAEVLGWGLVPETVLRDGPLGVGAVQRFVDHDPEEHYFTLLRGREDTFRRFAVLDVLANNADRKAGHVLRGRDDHRILGIDHGLTFHPEWKLRTVIWDFAGERLDPALADDVCRLAVDLSHERFASLLAPAEIDAIRARAEGLLAADALPEPAAGYHSLPWPLV